MRMHCLLVSIGHILMAAKEAWQLGEAVAAVRCC